MSMRPGKRSLTVLALLLALAIVAGLTWKAQGGEAVVPTPIAPEAVDLAQPGRAPEETASAPSTVPDPAPVDSTSPMSGEGATEAGPVEPIAEAATPAAAENSPEEFGPFDLDFVDTDVHTVVHAIAIRSGYQVIVQGGIGEGDADKVTIRARITNRDDLHQAFRRIAGSLNLECVLDQKTLILKPAS